MTNQLRTIEGAELGRFVTKLDEQIIDFVRQIPKFEGVAILLRFDDAYDNLMHTVLPELLNKNDDNNAYRIMTFDYLVQSFEVISESLKVMLVHGKSTRSQIIGRWPAIEFFAGYYRGVDDSLLQARKTGFLQDWDYYKSFEIPPMAIDDAKFKVILRILSPTIETKQFAIDFVWEIIEQTRTKLVCKTALHSKGQVMLNSHDQPVAVNMSADIRNLLGSRRTYHNIKQLTSSMTQPFDWASDFTNVGLEAMSTYSEGIFSEANIRAMAKESDEIYKTFKGFPGFRKSYYRMNGYTLKQFFDFVTHLENLARNEATIHDHSVYIGSKNDLENSCQSLGFTGKTLSNLFKSLTWLPESNQLTSPLHIVNDNYIFSMRRIIAASILKPNGFYERFLDGEIKGRHFEIHCRRLLRKEGLNVISHRIPVKRFLPLEVSLRLWDTQKEESDIDVVASLRNFVFVIECKAMKPPRGRISSFKESHEHNVLVKSSVENYYKALRLVDAMKSGELAVDVRKFLSKPKLRFVVPVSVTNLDTRIQGTSTSAAVISIADLLALCGESDTRIVQTSGDVAQLRLGPSPSYEQMIIPLISIN